MDDLPQLEEFKARKAAAAIALGAASPQVAEIARQATSSERDSSTNPPSLSHPIGDAHSLVDPSTVVTGTAQPSNGGALEVDVQGGEK